MNLENSNYKIALTDDDIWTIYCFSWYVNSFSSPCNNTSQSDLCKIRFWTTKQTWWWDDYIQTFQQKAIDVSWNKWRNLFWCVMYIKSFWNYWYIGITNNHNNSATSNLNIDYEILKLTPDNNWWWQQCDYTDYELKSNITENYCKNKFNNLIDENDCNCENEWENECTWWIENWTGIINWSSIYINNVQHNPAWLINITIPEEIERDYTNENDEINVDVLWYWYDQEKMQSMVNTQYYTPTPEDMNKLIWKIADFLPLMAIVLLVCYAWRLIKKIF